MILLAFAPSLAMTQSAPVARRALTVTLENDLIAVRGRGVPPDYDYTHGTRFALSWSSAPRWLSEWTATRRGCDGRVDPAEACLTTHLELAQDIYTPRRDAPMALPGERPYAGWLYARVGAHVVRPNHVRAIGAALGVIGPPSLGEQTQRSIHRLLGNAPQLGWADQLHTEPGVAIHYDESRLVVGSPSAGVSAEWGGVAGNVRTAAQMGVRGRIQLGRALPWSPGAPGAIRPTRFHALAALRHDLVLHSIFIDGNTFRDSPRARRRPLVSQLELGLGYRGRGYGIDYRYVRRGRDYRAQPNAHAYGSLSVGVWW